MKLNSEDLSLAEDGNIYIVDEDMLGEMNRYERTFTLQHKHSNCVILLNGGNRSVFLSNLEDNTLNKYGSDVLQFTVNSVPFDFDGE